MYMEQSSTDEKFLLEGNGDQTPRCKKRHVTERKRIAHLVEAYDRDSGSTDTLPRLAPKCYGRKLVFYVFNSNVIRYFETCVTQVVYLL